MAKTGHPNFDYTCQGLWRGVAHKFSITGNHSGTSFSAADAKTFMEGTASPYAKCFSHFQATDIAVVGARYYNGQDSAPVYAAEYDESNPAPEPLTALGDGFTGGATDAYYLPLEVCFMIEAVVGTSSTSKPIYCRKFIRGVPAGALEQSGSETGFTLTTTGTNGVNSMGDGTWYGNRVYISPSARQAIAGWTGQLFPYNHQVPRGRKRKPVTAANRSAASSLLEDAIALAGGIALAGA